MRLIPDGDVSGALLAVSPDRPVDLLWGIGGTPEGVISAARAQVLRRRPDRAPVRRATTTSARRPSTPATTSTACSPRTTWSRGDNCFFSATGVTDGDVLEGVRYAGARGASTESLVMRSRSGTVRRIQSRHDRAKLRELTARYG